MKPKAQCLLTSSPWPAKVADILYSVITLGIVECKIMGLYKVVLFRIPGVFLSRSVTFHEVAKPAKASSTVMKPCGAILRLYTALTWLNSACFKRRWRPLYVTPIGKCRGQMIFRRVKWEDIARPCFLPPLLPFQQEQLETVLRRFARGDRTSSRDTHTIRSNDLHDHLRIFLSDQQT